MRANLTQYHFTKTDFHLGTAPVIPSASEHGDASFSLIEGDGIFTSESSGNSLSWDHDDSEGFKIVNEGIFGIEDESKSDSIGYRIIGFKITIDVLGEREITNLGTNTKFMFDIYYFDDYSERSATREYTATPSYSSTENNSSIVYEMSTYWTEFDYQIFDSSDIYKIVLKTVSVEYSCSN